MAEGRTGFPFRRVKTEWFSGRLARPPDTQLSTFARLAEVCSTEKAALMTGRDRSGKSVIAKKMQDLFAGTVNPAILISGKKIRNKYIQRLANTVRNEQFEASEFPMSRFRVIVDDFDECPLPDGVKEVIIKTLCENYHSCILCRPSCSAVQLSKRLSWR